MHAETGFAGERAKALAEAVVHAHRCSLWHCAQLVEKAQLRYPKLLRHERFPACNPNLFPNRKPQIESPRPEATPFLTKLHNRSPYPQNILRILWGAEEGGGGG